MADHYTIKSGWLQRDVALDVYLPATGDSGEMGLLLVNDAQKLAALEPEPLLAGLYEQRQLQPLLVVGIQTGPQPRQEYGTARIIDSRGRGCKASLYHLFVLQELLPFLQQQYAGVIFTSKAFAGFSLGGLSALDIVWQHPAVFHTAGVFSGSLWWRSRELTEGYNEHRDRIMHRLIREGNYHDDLHFFFECGTADERNDRNHNGVIDAIDDTLDLIRELEQKGYKTGKDVQYLEITGGKHNAATWKKGMKEFVRWRWGSPN
jgi:enterochelin esterase-like enzyme